MNTEPIECEIIKYPNGFEVLIMKDVLIWDSKDSFNIHEISNIDEMFENLCEEGKTYHCYTQEQFNEVAKRHVRDIFEYDELFKISSFIRVFGGIFGTITSTNQDFIKLIKDTKKMPRIHPCYVGTCSHKTEIDKDGEKHITSIAEFEKFICWLAEFDKPQYELKIVEEEGKMEISEEDSYINLPISKIALRAIMEKHITNILSDSITDDGKDGWNYGERYNIFYWKIHTKTTILQIGAQISFDYENQCWTWEIHTHNSLNVNMRIYKDRIDLFNSKESCYDDFSYEFIKILQGKISDYMTRQNEAYNKEDKMMSEQHKEAKWLDELAYSINSGMDEFCDKACGNLQGQWDKSGTTRTIQFHERTHFSVICYTPENDYVHSIMMGVDNTPAIRIEVEEFKDHVMFNVVRGTQPPSNLFTEEEWLLMFDIMDKKMIELTKEYSHQKTDKNHPKETLDANNEKATHWETMRDGINATLNSFCDKIISNSIVGGSYEKLGSLRRITLGEKTIDIILQFDTDLDRWDIFVGDATKPRILINANGDIIADISAFIPDPLCFRDMQTLCDMLGVCKNKNWQVKEDKEDTREEQMESCEASDDKEDISKLIPKEELMKIIFENVKCILENDLSYHEYPWACPDNSWSLTAYDDSFRYVIYDRQHCVSKSIGCNFDKDHWEIYIDEASNVNIVVYPDEARWMTDALLFRTPNKDFSKATLENIIEDINAWIKTKTMPNKEFEAFSQSLIKDGKRPSKIDYYLAMAEVASTRGTCLRRRFGSVIVKDDRIVSTGYVGAPSGRQNCCDIGYCFREANNIPSGTMYERCRSSHSEMNAIINASKEEMEGATLYLVGVEPDGSYTNADCCAMCKRVIINSGIEYVVAKQKNGTHIVIPVKEWIEHDDSLDIDHKGY